MSDLLGDLTRDDLNADKILFDNKEVVQFKCKDFRRDEQKGHIYLKCDIESGIHKGKTYTVAIWGGDHEASKKRRAQFFFKSGFWTNEELEKRDIKLSRLVGRRFQGRAGKVTDTDDGEKFQNIEDIKDLGATEQDPASASQAAAAANHTSF